MPNAGPHSENWYWKKTTTKRPYFTYKVLVLFSVSLLLIFEEFKTKPAYNPLPIVFSHHNFVKVFFGFDDDD